MATVGSGIEFVIDLPSILTPPAMPTEELVSLGELASGQTVELGDLSGMTQEQWSARRMRFPWSIPTSQHRRLKKTRTSPWRDRAWHPSVEERPAGRGRRLRRKGLESLRASTREAEHEAALATQLRSAENALANDYPRFGLWEEAAPLFARGFEQVQQASIGGPWFYHPMMRLLTGDTAGYRRYTEALRERFDLTGDTFNFVRCGSMSPDSAVEPARLLQAVEKLNGPMDRLSSLLPRRRPLPGGPI